MFKLAAILFLFSVFNLQDDYKSSREQMVKSQIEQRGVTNPEVLKALSNVQRHLFVPHHLRNEAYDDRPLPIGYGQTISQPYIVAYMTEVINPKPGEKVLEIGTGSGYQAAILAQITDEVYTIEIITELANSASQRLKKLNYNVKVKNADGYLGWEEHAPYDAIVVTAAAEFIPPPLLKQLKPDGKMVIPVGSPFLTQTLLLVEKEGDKVKTKSLIPVMFVPFKRGEK